MGDWQPIETAPRDGTKILIKGGDMGFRVPTIASAMFDSGWWCDMWESHDDPVNPSYWMPLP